MSGYVSKALRRRVTEEARHRCEYCLTSEFIVGTPMEIEHIVPQAVGGLTEEDNLWLACSLCNDTKSDRVAGIDTATGVMVRLFDPRHDTWNDHFAWSDDNTLILGRTAQGRATVTTLNLNRPSLVAARRAWIQAGWHPPPD